MTTKKARNEALVGLFVILGFILLSLVVFFISGVYVFRPGYALSVMYDYVSILDKGAPIRMAGVRVGEVSKVGLTYDEAVQRVRVKVKLFIEKGVEIRENYEFKIQGTHILSEPHIEIVPMPGSEPLVTGSKVIEGVSPVAMEDMIERGQEIAENVADLTGSFEEILERTEKGQGTIGKLLTEDSLHQDMRDLIAEIKAHPWRLLKRDNEKGKKLIFF